MKNMLALAALLLSAVGPLAGQQPAVARLVVSPARPEVAVGDSLKLTAQALDASGNPVPDAKITFHEKGLQGASVDEEGMFRAGAPGTMEVTASAIVQGAKPVIQEITVRMLPGPATSVAIGPHPARLVPGQRLQLGAKVLTSTGDERDDQVTWTSTNPAVVRVSRGGLLDARGAGRATLTASAGSVHGTTMVAVTTAVPVSLAIEPAAPAVRQGDVVRFS
ncbi:MAG TPA: Ig-like domain-containing protein, partial [Gemmatimonadales bacterium]|nr:Ig-like domain-containing protein [Gemmatimonadales bacterium]